ncbi:MAG: hypothetical protein IPP77_03530 [Bacteroidetes bacterium]|nr:hypothetical protein [Bacteroidota bacterium]
MFWFIPLAASSVSEDSVQASKPVSKNDTWYIAAEPDRLYRIDSTIYNLEEYNFVQRWGKEYLNTGNTGTAAYPIVFDHNTSVGFNAGFNQFNLYRYHIDSIRYYRVIRPYAELSMILGLNNEQLFQGRFAHQVKNILFYGVDFTRIFSRGAYQNQRANDNGFNFYAIYNSKNKHWNVQADFILNNNKVQENGGVRADPFNGSYFQKKLVPVTVEKAENNYRQIDFHLKSSYNVGKRYYERKNDTTEVKTILPIFKISHHLNIEQQTYRFLDASPDPDYYASFFNQDTVSNRLQYLKTGNTIMLDLQPRKLTSDSTFIEKDFIAHAEAGYDYYFVKNNYAYD